MLEAEDERFKVLTPLEKAQPLSYVQLRPSSSRATHDDLLTPVHDD